MFCRVNFTVYYFLFFFSIECERSQTRCSAYFDGGSSLLARLMSIQNFIGTLYARHNFRKFTVSSDLLCEFQLLGRKSFFSSTSESLGITVTPGTFLIQSINMGDRELQCENLWFITESRSENSAEWAVLLGPPLRKPKLKLFASIGHLHDSII